MDAIGNRWSSPTISRRALLRAGTVAGGALVVPGGLARHAGAAPPVTASGARVNPRTLTPFVDPLPIPPEVDARTIGTLVMRSAQHRFHSQLGLSDTFGYGGASYLGPTFVAPPGQPASFTAVNELGPHPLGIDTELHGPDTWDDAGDPRVSVHLHGGYTDELSDGYPEYTFTPSGEGPDLSNRSGNTWRYDYANDQAPGTIWYHDHALGITRLNVYAGLAGFYLVKDDAAQSAVLPTGPFDIPLALQDKSFLGRKRDSSNPLFYPDPWEPEFFGDVSVVNGAIWPRLDVDRGCYRFRLLNGSSSRFYHLQPSHAKVPMWLVGSDSTLVDRPRRITSLVLSPGERVEVVLDFRNSPGSVTLVDLPLPLGVVSPAPGPLGDLVRFKVGNRLGGGTFDPDATLSTLPDPHALAAGAPHRTVGLVEVMDPATNEPMLSLLNNLPWPEHHDAVPLEEPTVDTVEVWDIVNVTADTHPIHLHLVQFQVLERQPFDPDAYTEATGFPGETLEGPWPVPPVPAEVYTGPSAPPAASEVGWKDTAQAHPGTVTRIVVPFGPNAAAGVPFGQRHRGPVHGEPAPFTGRYVWHCHILDHEDNEMMLPYDIRP